MKGVLILLLMLLATPLRAGSGMSAYFFANSLISYPAESEETTVPYWLARLARAGGHGFAADGQAGFLRDYARNLPPTADWGLKSAPSAWSPGQGAFAEAGYDAILFSPTNFIQYQKPGRAYPDAGDGRESPLSATLALLDGVAAAKAPIWVYQGWPDMGDLAPDFPPSQAAWRKYRAQAQSKYSDWYRDYLGELRAARPGLDLRLLPVSDILMRLLGEAPLNAIPVAELFTDNAPHGTATTYLLAAMITYGALYGEAPPALRDLPASIHPVLSRNMATVSARIAAELGLPEARPSPAPTPVAAPPRGLANPSLAMGLNGISDWSTQQPFLDLMKSARPWTGHLPGQWGGVEAGELEAAGVLDENGWPRRIPDNVTALEALILTDMPKEATGLAGRYRVTWKGAGELRVTGRGRVVSRAPGEIRFDYRPGEGSVGIAITGTDPEGNGDYIRDIVVLREDFIPLYEAGARFNPDWTALVEDMRVLRFMDWMGTNGSTQRQWADRPRPGDYTYGRRGVPVEVMLELANELGADPWFNMPHMADDDYVRRFAEMVRDRLAPGLVAYVEYSNEVWNFLFPQAAWAQEQARARWGDAAGGDGWMQYAGMRAARVAGIWTEVFGESADERLMRVIAVHTGWPGLEEPLLEAPLWQAEAPGVNAPPARAFDAYAVTGYFGQENGGEELIENIGRWLREGRESATREGRARGLSRIALAQYVEANAETLATERLAAALREQVIPELLTRTLPYHAKVAGRYGLRLIMYEGGSHVAATGALTGDAAVTGFFTRFNYTPEMAALYGDLLTGWQALGGTLFNAFVDVAKPSKWGSWGAWRFLGDENPRAEILARFNRETPAWWGNRDGESFLQGGVFEGTGGDDLIGGTTRTDTLLGGAGDDVLLASGDGDRLHGGAGSDVAVLPGRMKDYRFEWVGQRLRAEGPEGTFWLREIERVRFTP